MSDSTIKLVSSDEQEFVVERKVAEMSETIKNMLAGREKSPKIYI